jgi:hypothetical protein
VCTELCNCLLTSIERRMASYIDVGYINIYTEYL